jgi:hypothetical protein
MLGASGRGLFAPSHPPVVHRGQSVVVPSLKDQLAFRPERCVPGACFAAPSVMAIPSIENQGQEIAAMLIHVIVIPLGSATN